MVQKLKYLESWLGIYKCVLGGWMVDAVYVPPLLYFEEVMWHIKDLPCFSWLQSLILVSKLCIHWSI